MTWSRRDSYCDDQYALQPQPEEYPTMPVRTQIKQLAEPASYDAFEKFNFSKGCRGMTEAFGGTIDQCCSFLKLDFASAELAQFTLERGFSQETLNSLAVLFEYLREKKEQTTIQTILRMSRLPQKVPKTFENFDFSVLRGKSLTDLEKLQSIRTLAPVYAHRKLAFIGPAGTGKTHLAQAFGYECCKHGLKTYFIKASELRDKFTAARRAEKTASMLTSLVRPSCLIIDEIGHCEFDKENTRLFFDLIDRRYNKEGSFNIGFTINRSPSL